MIQIAEVFQMPYCVYGHFVDDKLIYIGSGELCRAFNVRSRMKHHVELMQSGKTEIVIFDRFNSREAASKVESDMLRACKPVANVKIGERQPRNRSKGLRKTKAPKIIKSKSIGKKSEAVLELLTRAAIENVPCPTNAEIAAKIGSMSYRVSDLVSSLAKRNLLKIDMHEANKRVVTVGEHSTKPTAEINVKGIATVAHGRRVIDRIIV